MDNVVLLRLTILAITILGSPAIAKEVSLAQLPGARIDTNWFRYVNPRFGTAIDIPARGYRYDVPVNSSGLSLKSDRGEVTITVYSHWVQSLLEDPTKDLPKAARSVSLMFDEAVDETRKAGGTITYSVKKNDFYVISGNYDHGYSYYERLIISPHCPAIFNKLRIFYATTQKRSLDEVVNRLSHSLRATCRGAEDAGNLKWLSDDD
jgi:hypothetical protein